MTLHACDQFYIPKETARVARETFPRGNVYMAMRDHLELRYKDSSLAHLFTSTQGRPAESPGLLSLVTIMQFAEGLTDSQAAEAVSSRIDWKYALGLPLTEQGFDPSILSDHRQRLLTGGAEQQLLNDMLQQLASRGLLHGRGQQRTDSTHVLAAIRRVNRLECIGETLRHALNSLAIVVPDWLRQQVSADWFELYGPRFEQYRLPKEEPTRQSLANRMGQDGIHLLSAVDGPSAPVWLKEIPAVQILRRVWIQQFQLEAGQVQLRAADNLPPAEVMIQSPYDPEARYSQKRQTEWTGYKVHLTETCEPDQPHLITNVETTPATTPDQVMVEVIHDHLAEKGLLPDSHLLDTGYMDADGLVASQTDHQVELLGPVQLDSSWQAQAGQGYDLTHFAIDWATRQVTCPQGKISHNWWPRRNEFATEVIDVRFAKDDCQACPARTNCTRSPAGPRSLKLRPQLQHEVLQTARQTQMTADFKERYKRRAGIEGTISQGTRAFDLRRSRYIGLAKTHLQHIFVAAAINLTRAVHWLNEQDFARTRRSPFAALGVT